MKILHYVGVTALTIGLLGCGSSEAASSGEAAVFTLLFGTQADFSGKTASSDGSVPYKTTLTSSKPYTVNMDVEGVGRLTTTVEVLEKCKYKVSLASAVADGRSEKPNDITVDFTGLKDIEDAAFYVEDSKNFYEVHIGSGPPKVLKKLGLSLEQMQTAVSDIKALCKSH